HPPYGRGYQIYVMRPDGTGQRRLTKGGLNVYPRFSPDGRRVAYCRSDKEGDGVSTVAVDGTGGRPVFREPNASANGVCWSPDGKRLAAVVHDWQVNEQGEQFLASSEDGNYRIELTDGHGQNRRVLEIAGARLLWAGNPDWR